MAIPSKSAILDYWLTGGRLFNEYGIFLDWGEPSCWACDYGWEGRYDVQDSHTPYPQLLKLWERAPLQRCHVVPRALGGTDDCENLVLMCAECHDLAPDTTDRGLFFTWMTSQSYFKRSILRVNEAVEGFGLDHGNERLMTRLVGVLASKEFQVWSKAHVGLHGRQRPPYGLRLKLTTMIAAALMYVERTYPGIPLDQIPVPPELTWLE